MIKMMCEQMYSGLDNLVTKTLNEKKQEISDADKKDNELIRSAMKKRVLGRSNAKLTKEEQDALERNGWKVNGRDFQTANGHYTFRDNKQNWYYTDTDRLIGPQDSLNRSRENRPQNPIFKSRMDYKNHKESPVNLADMGRKQEERAKNNPYDSSSWGLRNERERRGQKLVKGAKIDKEDSWRSKPLVRNRLFAEREFLGTPKIRDKYRDEYNDIKALDRAIKSSKDDIDYWYRLSDSDRQEYLKQIAYYKKKLAELDGETEARVQRETERISSKMEDKKQAMQKARERFANRHNKNESYRRKRNVK